MFVGDENVSQIQSCVIAHGNEVIIDHCVFYKLRNTVVFFQDSGDGIKTGNGITNSIIYGTNQGVWTAWPDKTILNSMCKNHNYGEGAIYYLFPDLDIEDRIVKPQYFQNSGFQA